MAVGVGWTNICSGGGGTPSTVSVTVSDTTPSYGDSVTVTITPTDITPTGYVFYLPNESGGYTRVSQAGNAYVWTVTGIGDCTVYGGATNGTDTTYDLDGIDITVSNRLVEGLTRWPDMLVGLYLFYTNFTGDIVEIRRSGDNATSDFNYTELTDGTATTWVSAGGGTEDGFVKTLYSQISNGRHLYHNTAGNQWQVIGSGVLFTDSQGLPIAKTVNPPSQLNFRGSGTSSSGTVYIVYKPTGGNLSGRYGSVLGVSANPAIGRFDDQETDTNNTYIDAGTPSNKVNGSNITNQRGSLGTAVLNTEVIHTITNIGWEDNLATWGGALVDVLEYCDNDTEFSMIMMYNEDGTDQQAYIEDTLNTIYIRY